jgi:hypothetical protein
MSMTVIACADIRGSPLLRNSSLVPDRPPVPPVSGIEQKYLSWTNEIAAQEQYLSELNASFVEAFKIKRRAQADRAIVGISNSEQAKPGTGAPEPPMIVQLGMTWIRLLVPDDGTLPYLTTCALAREVRSSRTFETCYNTKIAIEDPVAVNIEAFKAALALHAQKVAEMQVADLTVDP